MTTYKEIFGKPIKVLTGDPAPTPITYTVTVSNPGSGNVYYIDGVQTPTLELYEGNTYNFDYSAATGHPFRFATAADAAGSTEYTTGVSVDSNITTIVVASGAPNLFYYCTNHSGMGGRALTPAGPDEYTGQIWYNETTGKFRSVVAGGAWSSASSTINAKQRPGGCGTQTAGLACGGFTAPPASALGTTEEYNGSGWSSGGTLNTARGNVTLFGTQTAAVFSGKGSPSTPYAGTTELYNGTAWTTNPNSANDTYNYRSSCGTNTAGLLSGGNYPPTNRAAGVEEFNGTSFSEGGDLPQKQSSQGQAGTQTAAINSFGSTNSPVPGNSGDGDNAISLEYNGSTWTAGPNGNGVVPLSGYAMGSGTQTDAIFAGGPPTNSCKYDGTTFTVGPALATAQPSSAHGSSSASATWIAHGSPVPSVGTNTQEFNFSTNTFTAAAWSSGANMPEANYGAGSFGTKTAFVYFGGAPYPSITNATREYNGSSWSTTGNYIGSFKYLSGCGVETAGLGAGGSPPTQTSSAEYDGSSWTAGNSMSNQRQNTGSTMVGTQPAALVVGGDQIPATPRSLNLCEEYDGTNWTAGGNYPTVIQNTAAAGTQTAGWAAGGTIDSSPGTANTFTNATYEYNGSSWTAGGSLPAVVFRAGAAGTDTAGLIFSGTPNGPTNISSTFGYDGSSWSTRPSMATARQSVGAGGVSSPSTAAIGAGGYVTPGTTASTEEFTGETTSLNYKNISSS